MNRVGVAGTSLGAAALAATALMVGACAARTAGEAA